MRVNFNIYGACLLHLWTGCIIPFWFFITVSISNITSYCFLLVNVDLGKRMWLMAARIFVSFYVCLVHMRLMTFSCICFFLCFFIGVAVRNVS